MPAGATPSTAPMIAAASSIGWGNLPLWLVERRLDRGTLVRVTASALGAQAETTLTAFLLWRVDQPLGPAARHLRQRLLVRFSQG